MKTSCPYKRLHALIFFKGLGILVLLLLTLWSCSSSRSIATLNDDRYFKEVPKIVKLDDQYFLRFRYADLNTPEEATTTTSRIVNDSLRFSLPAASSSGDLRGVLQFEEIHSLDKILLIQKRLVFWENPDGTLTPMAVEPSGDNWPTIEDRIHGEPH